MKSRKDQLVSYSDNQRQAAMSKYKVIQPNLAYQKSLVDISEDEGIPLRTLQRWKKHYQENGLIGLVRKTRSDSGKTRLDPEVISEIESLFFTYRKMSIATIQRKLCKFCTEKKFISPSYSQVYKAIKSLPSSVGVLAHEGEKVYSEKFDLIKIREPKRPNEVWQADHTLLDIEIIDTKGVPKRPWLTIIMDDYSRAIAGYSVSFDSPSAIQTALTLHQAIWTKRDSKWPICGIPEHFYTDHGSDFTSDHLEQVAIDLRINLLFSKVGVPRGRGKIERFFLTVNQLFLESLPGYIGNSDKADRLNFQEFRNKLHHFLIYDYNFKEHSSIKMCPIDKWNSKLFLPNLPENLEKLDLLLLEISKSRKVHSDGIHFQGLRYTNPNLSAFVGESVLIRYNPSDIAEIRVFYRNQFLCNAVSPEISNYSIDINDLVAARTKRRKILKEKINSPSSVDLLITEQEEKAGHSNKKKKTTLKRYFNE
ncbi:DDE-type integrase/transposase/recombinase [Enterococcus raffinosus]|mgnify:CR=1 FL=1|uniref:Mu transposase C-terminal domain-containing protein n=1 Tax=Enterococcus TaxID=1350 RepID=UPI001C11D33D|nr:MULTISPECIES: Mu transposase C-terminal domain-containing protein [Enterococcus]MBU5362170.1 DDE-type integrase/transposase/recombinase [Enterococcus raffinosus]MDU5335118.1 Mu transposase C-terminal domain-containing protein [Enterococcus sp.]